MSCVLEELHIRGLGVIDDAVLALGPGLTVVTGETGAGKTMVVTGLLLLFGGRADSARVRAGAEQASIEGRLEVRPESVVAQRVRAAGGELDDGTGLVLRRTVSTAGRSRAYVGGAATPVGVLGGLAERLVAVHGQADQARLTRPRDQRTALDRFAAVDLGPYATAYLNWRDAAAALADRVDRMAELRREADLLTHGLAEIESAQPRPGEDAELATLAGRLAHADSLRLAARTAHDALVGDAEDPVADAANVVGLLGGARRSLSQQAGADPGLDELAARVADLAALAADVGADCGTYAEQLESDPARLEQIERRRAVLAALVRKYADRLEPDLDDALRWAERARLRLAEIDVSDEAIAALIARRDETGAVVSLLAAELSTRRREAAGVLSAAASAELTGLAMASARLWIEVRPRAVAPGSVAPGSPVLTIDGRDVAVGPDGVDEVEFLLQPHPDAPALAIGAVSGGELSRVMLALEVCLASTDPVPTMVFDEVDAGVGGRTAVEVGRRLARLSRDHQVVVVTHLPQVAAYADRHVVVDNLGGTNGVGVTASNVRTVSGPERVAEVARMLAGNVSDTALEHAGELLSFAAADRDATPMQASAGGRAHPAAKSQP